MHISHWFYKTRKIHRISQLLINEPWGMGKCFQAVFPWHYFIWKGLCAFPECFLCDGTCEILGAELKPSPICPICCGPGVPHTKQEGEAAIGSIRTASPARVALCSHRLKCLNHEKNPTKEMQLFKSAVQRFLVMVALTFSWGGWSPQALGRIFLAPSTAGLSAWWSPSHNDSGNVQVQAFSFMTPHVECDQLIAHGPVPAGSFTNKTTAEGWLRVQRFGLTNRPFIETSFPEVFFGRRTWNVCSLSQRSLQTQCGSV